VCKKQSGRDMATPDVSMLKIDPCTRPVPFIGVVPSGGKTKDITKREYEGATIIKRIQSDSTEELEGLHRQEVAPGCVGARLVDIVSLSSTELTTELVVSIPFTLTSYDKTWQHEQKRLGLVTSIRALMRLNNFLIDKGFVHLDLFYPNNILYDGTDLIIIKFDPWLELTGEYKQKTSMTPSQHLEEVRRKIEDFPLKNNWMCNYLENPTMKFYNAFQTFMASKIEKDPMTLAQQWKWVTMWFIASSFSTQLSAVGLNDLFGDTVLLDKVCDGLI
jgi:hypothetical protein